MVMPVSAVDVVGNGDFYFDYSEWTFSGTKNDPSGTFSVTWHELNATTHDGYVYFAVGSGKTEKTITAQLVQNINVTDVDTIVIRSKAASNYGTGDTFKLYVGSLSTDRLPTNTSWDNYSLNVSSLSGIQELKLKLTMYTYYDLYGTNYYVDWVRSEDYIPTDGTPPAVNDVSWELDQYTEGETASYTWHLQNSFWQDIIYKYRIQIFKDGSEIDTVRVSQTGTRYQEVNTAGNYEVKLQYSGLIFTNWISVDSDSVNVIPRVDSFINVPQTSEQKTNFTVNYLYGTTPPTAAIIVKKLDEQLEAYVLYDIVYLDGGTANIDYSQNISIWSEGFYKLVLYNANVPEADLKTDVIQITKVIIPPQTIIDMSRIRSQLETYSVSDMVWGDYAVDFTNYTDYVINLELYNYEYDSIVYSETIGDQSGVVLIPLYSTDLTVFTGLNNIRLSSYSNTGVFVDDIVHDNFTINLVNVGGYGLTLSKYEVYTDEIFVIKCIIPQASTIRIINRLTLEEIDNFEINTSSYTNYKISQIGDYEIRLISSAGHVEGNQYIKVVEGTAIDDPVDDDEIDDDVTFGTKFESMLSSDAFVALLIIIACVGAFGKIGGVVGVFLGMVVGISISFLMGHLPAWILFIMVLALCVVFVSKLINSFGGGE